jgi:lipopolysaccharide export LptBFGC system permease protein LptF
MNLKSFHVVFIGCAIALAFVLGVWALGNQALAESSRTLVAIGAFASGLALVAYEAWFLRYSRRRG